MNNRPSPTNRKQQKSQADNMFSGDDQDKSTKKVLGTINQVDPKQKGRMTCTVWLPTTNGGRRLWGNGQEIVIVNSPLDMLMRFGGLRSGMVVEVSWKGIAESGIAYVLVIGEPEDLKIMEAGEQIPRRNIDTQSSVPFEPMGV
jgi:hypothetical protein